MRSFAARRLSVRRVFVLNGVNLGALGTRRPEVYGTLTLGDIEGMLRERYPEVDFEFRQTDYEGEMVGYVREARGSDGILINPGAWSHYSYAIHDALEAVEGVLKLEIHLSNVHAREPWRRHSVISPAVDVVVAGMGHYGYEAALGYVLN
jgi:3-dehydroquinate dehydratase II